MPCRGSTSTQSRTERAGGFQSRITASGSLRSIRRKSLECSNAFIQPQNMPVQAWALRFVSGSSTELEAAFGSNLNSDEVRRFTLQFPAQVSQGPIATGPARQILL